jgi:UDP-N-acetylmuramoyl-L-alanyl-D-glutamate--2,6-diaminopimelate ligase
MATAGTQAPRLADLVGEAAAGDVEITDLALDSRRVRPGALFFCVPGLTRDGHDFAPEAVRRGAAALVVERRLELDVPQVVVPSVRAAMGPVASRFHGDPSAHLDVVGVTGTNGKTTTAYLIRSMLEAAGRPCGLLGTVKAVVGGVDAGVTLTTPEALDVQHGLRRMVDAGDRACVIEVSSHGLALARTDGIRFAAGVFTNLTRDHLDFHRTMEEYFHAKRRLFVANPRVAVINVDDPFGHELADEYQGAVTVALDRPATYRGLDVETTLAGSRFKVSTAGGVVELHSPLPGHFNVLNALTAFAAARALGVDEAVAAAALADAEPVPGRFQVVGSARGVTAIVDFAHTPDALDNTLRTARELTRGRTICVFGCAGGRDRGTRAPMGRLAAALADRVVVTSDDPGDDDPRQIAAEVVAGMDPACHRVEVVVDRAQAIARGIELARPGDLVLIAGRGHERWQTLAGGERVPFDDVEVTREALSAREGRRPPAPGAPGPA